MSAFELDVIEGREFLADRGSRLMEPKRFILTGWQAEAVAIDVAMTLGVTVKAARAAVRLEYEIYETVYRRSWWRKIIRR